MKTVLNILKYVAKYGAIVVVFLKIFEFAHKELSKIDLDKPDEAIKLNDVEDVAPEVQA